MRLRIFVEPQLGATYEQQLAMARASEEAGFDALFRSDHYLTMGGDGLPGPTDAWITLAGLARETSTIRLGTLLTSATFRLPGVLAITVAQVDAMSGGRVELGLGAGWALAARFADEFNTPFALPETCADLYARLDQACGAIGRDPAEVGRSAAVVVCCGSDDAEVARRAAAIGREVDELKANGACGTPGEVAEKLARWAEVGAGTAYLQCLDMGDLDHVRLIGAEVVPLLA